MADEIGNEVAETPPAAPVESTPKPKLDWFSSFGASVTGAYNPEPGMALEGPEAQDAANKLNAIRGLASWPKDQPLPPIYRSMASARAAGHSWDDINKFLLDGKKKALEAGYSEDDINKLFLGVPVNGYIQAPNVIPPHDVGNANAEVGVRLRQFSERVFGPHNPYSAMGLPTPGGDYTAGGILKHIGWTVVDFGRTFGSAVVNGAAATAELFDGRDRTPWEAAKLAWESSQFLMLFAVKPGAKGAVAAEKPPIPAHADFLDAATAIVQKHPEGVTEKAFGETLRMVGDHYLATQEHPVETASNVVSYSQFMERWEKAHADTIFGGGLRPRDSGPTAEQWNGRSGVGYKANAAILDMEALAANENRLSEAVRHDSGMPAADADVAMKDAIEAESKVVPPERVADPQPLTLSGEASKRFTELLGDESGALRIGPRTDIQPETLFMHDPMLEEGIAHTIKRITSPYSLAPHAAESAAARLAQSAVQLERATNNLVRFGRAVGELSTVERFKLIDAIEAGDLSAYRGTTLGAMASQLRKELDFAWNRMDKLGIAPNYITDYLPHMYANPATARKWLIERSPMAGGKAFTKERTFGSYADAREAGLVPATDNPITMTIMALKQMNKYIAANKVLADFRAAGVVNPYKDIAPDGWVRINGQLGVTKEGNLYAPRDVAQILNSVTSPGFSQNSLYQMARTFGNDMIGMQLAGPGFHATFVTVDTFMSDLSLAAKQASRVFLNAPSAATAGEAAQAIKTAALSPIAPIRSYVNGRKLAKYLMGELPSEKATDLLKEISNAYIQGGGRVNLTEEYRGSAYGNFLNAIKGTFAPSTGYATLAQEFGQIVRDQMAKHGGFELDGRWVTPGLAKVMYHVATRTMDTIAAPLMAHYVPTMKMGVFHTLMADALRAAPEMGPLEVRHVAHTLNKSIDNRLGEMVYDNRFWNKYLKDASHLMIRAVGWNMGDIAELGGGLYDAARLRTQTLGKQTYIDKAGRETKTGGMTSLTDRTSYVAGMTAGTMLLGALVGYMSGTWHEGWSAKDYLFPPTKPDGQGRIALPSYGKEVYHFSHDPLKFGVDKLNPMWMVGLRMYNNRDWDGSALTDPGEGPLTNAEDYAKWFARQYMPITVQKQLHPTDADKEIPSWARVLGINPAPYAAREPEKAEKYRARDEKAAVKKMQKKRAKEAE